MKRFLIFEMKQKDGRWLLGKFLAFVNSNGLLVKMFFSLRPIRIYYLIGKCVIRTLTILLTQKKKKLSRRLVSKYAGFDFWAGWVNKGI